MFLTATTWARQRCLAHLIFAVFLLGGCADGLFLSPLEQAERLASKYGWRKQVFRTGIFDLTGFSRTSEATSERLAVYIEGDGRAWLSRYRLSPDPTPSRPYVLELAVRHPLGNVLYLARPCQYVGARTSRACDPRFWAADRYAPEVIAAMGRAIDRMKQERGARRLVLIGFSGGGVVAALLAAHRADVVKLVTIAANLDHRYWTRTDGLTPLQGSLNPVDFTARLGTIPQVHFVGAKDRVVPAAVVDSYVRRLADRSRTRVIVLKDFDHDCCWIDNWPELLGR